MPPFSVWDGAGSGLGHCFARLPVVMEFNRKNQDSAALLSRVFSPS